MKKYKALVLGPQCAGKTTLNKYLSERYELPIVEEDSLLRELHGGTYPKDVAYKDSVLRPKVEQLVSDAESIIFFTSYYDEAAIEKLRERGFKIIQLSLDREEFEKRNKKRMEEKGTDDAKDWADDIFDFHERIRRNGLIDAVVDAAQPTEQVTEELLENLI